jgi:hypothetical protein
VLNLLLAVPVQVVPLQVHLAVHHQRSRS